MKSLLTWVLRGLALGILAFVVFGPLANLVLWAFAEQWYFPHKLPLVYGLKFWNQVFKPSSDVFATLATSVSIALFCVVVCLALALPAGFALARGRLPCPGAILPPVLPSKAFPTLPAYF